MIDLTFRLGSDLILVKINGSSVLFGNTSYGKFLAPIEGLRLSKQGVIKEFPDLEDNKDWEVEAVKRFKEKIKKMKSEKEIADYIVKDLKGHGYVPHMIQLNGNRPKKL